MRSKFLFSLLTLLLSGAVTLALAEAIVRLTGHGPHTSAPRWPNVPISKQPDSVLGWKQKPGRYVYPPFVAQLPDIRMTIDADGTRVTGASNYGGAGLAVFGCSYTEGEHISDEETFAWKLQSRYPDHRVRNYGVAGYGTYQSELLMQNVLGQSNPPKKVLYGFMEHHEARNIAHPAWLKGLSSHSTEGEVALPFATLDARGRLIKQPQRKYPQWPLANVLASVAFVQDLYVSLEARGRESQEVPVTKELMREMNDLAKARGVEFAVVLLYGLKPEAKLGYADYFAQHGIEYYDCEHPKTPDHVVPGEGHPNGKLNTVWAKCIAKSLEAKADGKWVPRKDWADLEPTPSFVSNTIKGRP
jgi:hypothetical protein